MRVDIQDCSKAFLEGMAKSISRTIDAGTTHNEEGYPLHKLLDEVFAQIETAPGYEIEHGRHR